MAATLLSRLLGWVKLTSLSSLFGRSIETDAFFGAFAVPDLIYLLVSGGAMTAAFIPIFTEFITTGKEKEGWRFASTVWNMIAVFLIVVIIIGEVFSNKAVLLLPGFRHNPEALGYAAVFVRILFPMLLFTALAAMCNGVLHSFNHFTAPSVSWIIYNVCFIAAAYIFKSTLGLRGVCIGVLAGAAMMVIVQLPVMMKKGLRYSLSFDYKNPEVIRYWKMFLPVMLGMSLTQINLMIMPTVFGSVVGKGAITALNNANRMMFIPLGVFGSAISMAVFPTMARQAGTGDFEMMGKSLTRGVRATMIFSLPCTALLITCGLAAIRIVFGYGRYKYVDCSETAFALTFFAIGLMGHSANQVINRGFYARKDSITPVVAGIIGLFVTIPLATVLIKTPLRHGGVALAISIATLLNMLILIMLAKRKLSVNVAEMTTMFFKTAVASIALGFTSWWVGSLFRIGPDRFSLQLVFASLAAMTAAGGVVFVALVKIMKVEEFDEIVGMVIRRFKGKKAA